MTKKKLVEALTAARSVVVELEKAIEDCQERERAQPKKNIVRRVRVRG